MVKNYIDNTAFMSGPAALTRRHFLGGISGGCVALTCGVAYSAPSLAPKPLVLAHRGASAWRPEHTLASYAKAMVDGADYIEPDLVMTRDGHFMVRHECNIAETTDVKDHPEFASRKCTRLIDGEEQTGWFTIDFTLAELKTLRARERLASVREHNTRYNDMFEIPTFEEVIELVAAQSTASGKIFGIIPEIKHSTFFHHAGYDPEDVFLRIIASHEYTRQAPLEVQSFETTNLKRLRDPLKKINPQARLMLLMGERSDHLPDLAAIGQHKTFGDLMTAEGLRDVKSYADAIGPSHTDIIPRDSQGAWLEPTSLVHDAHREGLLVHSYTARPENIFLPTQLRNSACLAARNPNGMMAEIQRYLDLGLDGFFTDDPQLGRSVVDHM